MAKALQPFTALGSPADPNRVKKLLSSEVYEPVKALFTLGIQLRGEQKKLLNQIWRVAMTAAQQEVIEQGYSNDELSAALSVSYATVAPSE